MKTERAASRALQFSLILGVFVLLLGLEGQAQLRLPNVRFDALSNGIKVYMLEQRQLPMAYITLMIRAGSGFDRRGQEGLARFTAAMLTQGTAQRTAEQIAEEIDFVGGELSARAELERAFVSVKVLKRDFRLAMRLLGEIVHQPVFPDAELEVMRRRLLGEVSAARDNPTVLLSQHLAFALYGPDHPLGRFMTAESLGSITRDDLVGFHQEYYRPNGAILVVAGDINPAEVMQEAKRALIRWPSETRAVTLNARAARTPGGYEVRWVQKPGQTQVQIGLAHGGIAYSAQDYVPAQLANYILGGGAFSSRLLKVVRSEAGKTYSISSRFAPYRFPGIFQIQTFSRNEEALATVALILREFRAFSAGGITQEELDQAIGAIAGRHILRFETLSGFAQAILDRDYYERGPDWLTEFPHQVRAVTQIQVNSTIQNRFDPENVVIVLLGDRKILEGQEMILGNVPTGEIGVVNWTEPVNAQAVPLRVLTQARVSCAPDQVCAAIDESAQGPVRAWLQVQGGLAAIAQIKDAASRWVGQGGNEVWDQHWQSPDKWHLLLSLRGSRQELVVNGGVGWFKVGSQVADMGAQDLIDVGTELFFFHAELLPKILNDTGYRLTLVGSEAVGGVPTDVIEVRSITGQRYKFYLDQQTHRLIKLDLLSSQQEYFFEEYRQVGGVWPAFKVRIYIQGRLISDLTLEDVRYNRGVDPKLFEK